MGTLKYQFFYERHWPPFQPLGATLFLTFRLAGSVPGELARQLCTEAERVEAVLGSIPDPDERRRQAGREQRRLSGEWDSALDAAWSGPTWFRDPRIADMVSESLHCRAGRVYGLDAFCIMPNHVHVVFTPLITEDGTYNAMPAIMQSLKRYTARQANVLLGREGSFWQHESYDHVVRDEGEWQRIITYVLNNPVKAGLVKHWEQWSWTFCRDPM